MWNIKGENHKHWEYSVERAMADLKVQTGQRQLRNQDKKVQSTSDKEMQFYCLYICRDMHLETQVGPLANELNVCVN